MDEQCVSAHYRHMKPIYFQLAAALAANVLLAASMASARQSADEDANWLDAPQTPGDWRYLKLGAGSSASFHSRDGTALFTMQCQPAGARIVLSRAGSAEGQVMMRIRTETRDQILTAAAKPSVAPEVSASLPSRDPLLDAMAITKGRFAMEVEGMEPLYLPAWAEVTRVIEDCR